jgi:hypothetical protein
VEWFGLKQKAAAILALIVIMSTAFMVLPQTQVLGQSPFGAQIYQIVQKGGTTAITTCTAGQPVTVQAAIDIQNGPYKVWFENTLVDSNNASGYFIASNFTIPEFPTGNYTVTLNDATQNINYTSSLQMTISYGASAVIPAFPGLLQEGAPVSLNVTVLGGAANTNYVANITVMIPAPLATNYTRTVSLTTNSKGTSILPIPFPDSNFAPSGSSSIYTGTYTVAFNETANLAKSTFIVGFTDFTQYHRQDKVNIRAVGYRSGESGTIKITYEDNSTVFSQSVTATSDGVMSASWTVPNQAALGTYAVTVTGHTTTKAVADVQGFTLPGYLVSFRALNLGGEYVPDINVESVDQASGKTYNSTTDIYGYALIFLERGTQVVSAFWKDVKVGNLTFQLSGNTTQNVQCKLTDFRITVQAKQGSQNINIPFVSVNITYTYTTRSGSRQMGSDVLTTELNGACQFNSTLPDIDYTITASKFNTAFSTTTSRPTAQALYQTTVNCPDETLNIKTLDFNSAPLASARLQLTEQASGIFYTATTDGSGSASVIVAFGQYRIAVYSADNIFLNETTLNVVKNTDTQVRCVLFNLDVSVKVVDYFGNPISNVQVQFSRPGIIGQTASTGGDGIATFNNVVGGNIELTAYPSGNQKAFVASNLNVESPTSVQLKMTNFVSLGGMLLATSVFATIIIIVVVVLLFVGIELFRRFRLRGSAKAKDSNGQS